MAPSKSDFYDKYRPGSTWAKKGLLLTPILEKDLLIKLKIKTSATIGVCELVDVIETDDATSDLYIATPTADNSIVPMFYIPDTENNMKLLARDNSVNSYMDISKDTATFTADTVVDAYLLVPGMILSLKFANSTTVKTGVKVQSAGSRKMDLYGTVNARVGHLLGQFESTASLKWGAVMVTF